MQVLLVVNQYASTTNLGQLPALVECLATTFEVATQHTQSPGHARELAAGAADSGFEAVLTWGGDGTASQAADGIISSGSSTILAPLPGGHGNVLCRNLGFPRNVLATAQAVAAAIQANRVTTMGAGRVMAEGVDRWFVVNSGLGPDAGVLNRMQQRRQSGRTVTDAAYLRLAVAELLAHRGFGAAAVQLQPGGSAAFAMLVNLSPWAYLGHRAVNPSPRAGRDDGFALYAATRTSLSALARMSVALLRSNDLAAVPGCHTASDLQHLDITAARPMWLQADGEVLGQVTRVTYQHRPAALRVVFGAC